MRGRSVQVYRGKPTARRKRGPKWRRQQSRGLGLVSVVFVTILLAGASFGAVIIDWEKVLSGLESDTVEATTTGAIPSDRSQAPADGLRKVAVRHAPQGDEMTEADAREIAAAVSRKGPASLLEDFETKAKAIKPLGIEKNYLNVELAGVRLRLEAPKGQCLLDPAQQADARVLGMMTQLYRGELRALHGFADCNELNAWRTGQRMTLSHYGDYLVPVSGVGKTSRSSSRVLMNAACRTMREYNGEFNGWREAGLKGRIEKALEKYKENQVRLIGVIDQDDSACYFATVQKTKTENGETKTQINVVALALIGGKILYIDLYSVLENDKTIQSLLKRQKINIERNVAANS